MKKLLLFLTILSSLYSEATFYVGSSIAYQYEILSTGKKKAFNTTENINLKVGYGDIKAYSVEFSVDYAKNDSNIVSPNDEDKYGYNIELLKSFDYDLFFIPFVKVGFGSGTMKAQRELQTKISYGSYNFGAGIYIPINKDFDLEFGYLYKTVSYEKFTLLDETIELNSHQNNSYAGINFRF